MYITNNTNKWEVFSIKFKYNVCFILIIALVISTTIITDVTDASDNTKISLNEASNQQNVNETENDKNENSKGNSEASALPMYIFLAVLLIGSFIIRVIYYNSKR